MRKKRMEKTIKKNTTKGLKIGYARCSTEDQNLTLQLDALKAAGCKKIYNEKVGGKEMERLELTNCLKALRPGDTLVVWKLDRLGRSLIDLVSIVNNLPKLEVAFESLTEKIDTSTTTGQLIFHIFAALADYERTLIRERTMAGLAAARKRGNIGGRPPILTIKKIQ
jgi:DNA invertase Pin-like site-specific DNA recombinase